MLVSRLDAGLHVVRSDARSNGVFMMGHRLLIVDDEPSVCSYIARVAENAGYQTLVVPGADSFLEHVRSWQPTHITLDLQMPVVGGLELLSQLASDHCRASIILISGVGDRVVNAARHVGTARGLNVIATLTKPFTSAELTAVLRANRREDPWLTVTNFSGAIDRQEFFLLFQPKVNLRSGAVSGAEALVRWRHPLRGVVPPLEFIPFAELSACIDQMTQWVGRTAAEQLRAWDDVGCRIDLSINVSARNLHEARLAERLEELCRTVGVDPARMTLELTETAAMRDAVQMMDVLTRLRVKGFKLSIDDFGTGYSSLVQLHRLPFNEIKIDRAFVGGCVTSPESRSIVRLVIDLAHALGMTAVAEGVESSAALRLLRDLGCDEAQGVFIAEPLDAVALQATVMQHEQSDWYRAGGPWQPVLV